VIGTHGSNLGSNISWIVIVAWVVVWVAGISVKCESIPDSLGNNLLNCLSLGISSSGFGNIILLFNILLSLLLNHVEERFSINLGVVSVLIVKGFFVSGAYGDLLFLFVVLSELDSSDIAAEEGRDG